MKATIPAAAYIRRSTDKQEMSLADQRREIERYAARHGYRIVKWYEDDGISGDRTDKRGGFQSLHKTACNGRDFEVILCWDQDRFGRFDSMEAGYWVHPLRKAGVRLVTITEGPVDWNDFTGRMMYGIKQEGKHQFLIDLSRNTARGQITNAKKGYLCGQDAPYGYDRMMVDEAGKHRQRVKNGEQYAKPRSWHVTLVPSDDPEKVKWAKWLFRTYATQDVGLRMLADELNAKGIPGPGGGTWWIGTIREILKNVAYVGDFRWARRRMGKYHRVAGEEIKRREYGDDGVEVNPEEEWLGKADAHEALVDRKTFERVQRKLTQRRKQTSSHKTTNGDRYVLTGLLFCGHCGAKMYGSKKTRRKGGKVYESWRYVCSSYHTQGKTVCGCHSVDQGDLLKTIVRKLQEIILGDEGREAVKERIRSRLEARQAADPAIPAGLRAKIAQLDQELDQGAKRLLRVPDDVADLVARELSSTRRERERLAGELADLESAGQVDIEAATEAAVDRIWKLSRLIKRASPAQIREILHEEVGRIDLHFRHVKKSTRTECPFSNGSLHLRPESIFSSLVSRGDWI